MIFLNLIILLLKFIIKDKILTVHSKKCIKRTIEGRGTIRQIILSIITKVILIENNSYIVPFYHDGFGNFACFDTRKINKNGSCPIVFWEHDVEYNETYEPDVINNSFVEFVLDIFSNKSRIGLC